MREDVSKNLSGVKMFILTPFELLVIQTIMTLFYIDANTKLILFRQSRVSSKELIYVKLSEFLLREPTLYNVARK